MGLFANQFSNVVEWDESKEGVLFWKWQNEEIKKGSVLIIRPGQDAIFMYNGKVEGVFVDEGQYDIESDIIPFLTTLKSFKFGFNTPLRAEVMFINTKQMLVKWGTKNAINLQAPGLPGGMPIRAFGTFACKVESADDLIKEIAGIKSSFTVDDVKERIITNLNPLLMNWIGKEGRNMFNLQADAISIGNGIKDDLDKELRGIGISITEFNIESFSYPEEIQKMQEKAAGQAMIGDVNKYQQIAAADAMTNGNGGSVASDMVQLQMGMMMGQQMVQQMNGGQQANTQMTGNMPLNGQSGTNGAGQAGTGPKFCPECGAPTNGMKFCGNCGNKLI